MNSPDQLANKLDLSQLTNLFIDQSKELYWVVKDQVIKLWDLIFRRKYL